MVKSLLLSVALWLPILAPSAGFGAANYALSNAFQGVSFTNPVCIASAPGETNRLFIVEKKGRIVVITNLSSPTRTVFMDISSSSQVLSAADTSVSGEEGLLGLAFHPGYSTNGFFYLFYTGTASTSAGSGRHDILSRFHVSNSNPNQGDPASEIRYILQYDEANNHNAGDLHFGADGYLYVSLGDEGGSYGQYGNPQKIDHDFFSAIMRIDVDKRPGNPAPNSHASALPSLTNYAIPSDNPFVGATSFNGLAVNPVNVRTEFWAVGMRNPWRFSFDPVTGELYLGHVGQGTIEWVNIVAKGNNCGWNYYEGNLQWTNSGSIPGGFVRTPPLVQYSHAAGRVCVIGGVVYRGLKIVPLYGAYLYADYGSGEIWALRHSGTNVIQNSTIVTNSSAKFTAFGVDPSNGDVLCAEARGGTNSTIERLNYIGPPPPSPRITDIGLAGNNVTFRGTNGLSNQTYYVLASSNLVMPASSWAPVATGSFDPNGNFALTNSLPTNSYQRFFKVQVP